MAQLMKDHTLKPGTSGRWSPYVGGERCPAQWGSSRRREQESAPIHWERLQVRRETLGYDLGERHRPVGSLGLRRCEKWFPAGHQDQLPVDRDRGGAGSPAGLASARRPLPAEGLSQPRAGLRALYRSGTLSMSARTASVDSGTIRLGSFFGSLIPSQGDADSLRSRTAALKMAATMPWATPTVAGESPRPFSWSPDMPFTHRLDLARADAVEPTFAQDGIGDAGPALASQLAHEFLTPSCDHRSRSATLVSARR